MKFEVWSTIGSRGRQRWYLRVDEDTKEYLHLIQIKDLIKEKLEKKLSNKKTETEEVKNLPLEAFIEVNNICKQM